MRNDWAYQAKSRYASVLRWVGAGLAKAGLLPRKSPPRENLLRQWLVSLFRVHDSLAIADLDVPWWTYRSIDRVDRWLAGRSRPVRVFEYGSGASTLWLARRADQVVTVEHHRGFANSLSRALGQFPNIRMLVVEPVASADPAVPSEKSGNRGLDFAEYAQSIERVGGTFDVVVVDGRVRGACLRAAVPHLAADGLLIFDNSRRRRYREPIETSGLREFKMRGLTPTLPYPEQTSLLMKPEAAVR